MNQENEQKTVEQIRASYEDRGETNVEKLIKLDQKIKLPAEIFAYSFGIGGTLVLGVGMCLALEVIGNIMPLGIVIGVLGIAMISANYFIFRKIEKSRKKKYGEQILKMTDEMIAH